MVSVPLFATRLAKSAVYAGTGGVKETALATLA
jgi:hypothetical protein